METTKIIEARRKAEDSVKDMEEGHLKVKAFEVIFSKLLDPSTSKVLAARHTSASAREGRNHSPASIAGRILMLREEGFFEQQRTISDIKEELRVRGWHIPVTTLSGRLQGLVQQKKLRREKISFNSKKVWKYSNP